jgi:hypothetical protein
MPTLAVDYYLLLKKIFAILLLASFSVQLTGYHLYFHFMQQDIKSTVKKKIRSNIETKITEQFVFSLSETNAGKLPQWEGDDEFRLNGEMYDVVDKKVENGEMIITCISDKKETELINNYKDVAGKDFGGSSKKRAALILKLVNTFYAIVENTVNNIHSPSAKTGFVNNKYPLSFSTIEVLTPPPQFV